MDEKSFEEKIKEKSIDITLNRILEKLSNFEKRLNKIERKAFSVPENKNKYIEPSLAKTPFYEEIETLVKNHATKIINDQNITIFCKKPTISTYPNPFPVDRIIRFDNNVELKFMVKVGKHYEGISIEFSHKEIIKDFLKNDLRIKSMLQRLRKNIIKESDRKDNE